jgi:hypothetical protein
MIYHDTSKYLTSAKDFVAHKPFAKDPVYIKV